mmetsp:Transcript_30000/g.54663  ORF Transcript_30000/g.54663 Transcript_30000/m.54663 type:complete len:404 (-) Transcript_30000:107-1318(-)
MGANQSGTDGAKPEAAAKAAASPAAEPSASAGAAPAAKPPAAASSKAASTPAPAAEVPKGAKSTEPAEDADAADEAEGFALCVRKLGEDVTTEKLKAVFEAKGPVVKAEVKMNEAGKCRGLGIIIVPTKEEADKVISNASAYEVDGKPVDIRPTKGRGKGRERSQKGAEPEAPAAAAAAPAAAAAATTPKGKSGKGTKGKGKEGKGGGKTSLASAAHAPEFVPGQYNEMQREMYEAQRKYMTGVAQQYWMYQAMWQAAYMQQYGGNQQAAAAAAAASAQGANPSLPAGQAQEKGGSGAAGGKGAKAKKKGSGKAAAKEASKPTERVEVAADKVFNGTLKSVSQRNGYGFLQSGEAWTLWGRDVYVDSEKELVPGGIKLNDEVTFNVVLSDKNHPQATNVKKSS